MASGEEKPLEYVDPLLQVMGKEIHIITMGIWNEINCQHGPSDPGGSAYCGLCGSFELGGQGGVGVQQLYNIINSAGGASWIFCNCRQRTIQNTKEQVTSALAIFVKDMDIVHNAAKDV